MLRPPRGGLHTDVTEFSIQLSSLRHMWLNGLFAGAIPRAFMDLSQLETVSPGLSQEVSPISDCRRRETQALKNHRESKLLVPLFSPRPFSSSTNREELY